MPRKMPSEPLLRIYREQQQNPKSQQRVLFTNSSFCDRMCGTVVALSLGSEGRFQIGARRTPGRGLLKNPACEK